MENLNMKELSVTEQLEIDGGFWIGPIVPQWAIDAAIAVEKSAKAWWAGVKVGFEAKN